MNSVWISAGITTKQGISPEQVKQALNELRLATLHENGCIMFDILQNNEQPEHFTLWEQWQDQATLEAHFNMPHTLSYFKKELTDLNYIERLTPIGIETGEVNQPKRSKQE